MRRRTAIACIGTAGLLGAVGGGRLWLTRERDHAELALDRTFERLAALDLDAVRPDGPWGVARTLDHLAQSVEFSMEGFPVMKPEAFRRTVGRLAFSVFRARGRMSHGLDEPIPGEVVASTSAARARDRLLGALRRFERFDAPLRPHFAYGALDKPEYALAHALHVDDHLGELRNA